MQCRKHHPEPAVATCSSCGAALCPICIIQGESGKLVCSTLCREIASKETQAINEILKKGRVGLAFSWIFLIMGGLPFLVVSVFGFIYQKQNILANSLALSIGGSFLLLGFQLRKMAKAAA